jgi:hypothetical protein
MYHALNAADQFTVLASDSAPDTLASVMKTIGAR